MGSRLFHRRPKRVPSSPTRRHPCGFKTKNCIAQKDADPYLNLNMAFIPPKYISSFDSRHFLSL